MAVEVREGPRQTMFVGEVVKTFGPLLAGIMAFLVIGAVLSGLGLAAAGALDALPAGDK